MEGVLKFFFVPSFRKLLILAPVIFGLWMGYMTINAMSAAPSATNSLVAEFNEAELTTAVSPYFQQQWLTASTVVGGTEVGHIFEGETAKVKSRLRTLEAVGSNPQPPNGGCYYRAGSDFHSEAILIRWLFAVTFKGNSHAYDGGMFLSNLSNPSRSTIIPNHVGGNGNSVPPDFKRIPDSDPRCNAAYQLFIEFVRTVADIIGSGPWPGLPLAP